MRFVEFKIYDDNRLVYIDVDRIESFGQNFRRGGTWIHMVGQTGDSIDYSVQESIYEVKRKLEDNTKEVA